jgi:hypothetical protein
MNSEPTEKKLDAYLEKLIEAAEKIGNRIQNTNRSVKDMINADNERFERDKELIDLDGLIL